MEETLLGLYVTKKKMKPTLRAGHTFQAYLGQPEEK